MSDAAKRTGTVGKVRLDRRTGPRALADDAFIPGGGAERSEQLHALFRMAAAIGGAADLDGVLTEALASLTTAIRTDRSAVLLFDPDGVLRFKSSRGLSDEYCRAVEGHSPWTRDEIGPTAIAVPDVEREPSLAPFLPAIRAEGIGALAFIPLLHDDRLLGKFMAYFDEPHDFTDDEIQLATAIAGQVGVAVAQRRQESSLRFLAEASTVLASSLDYEETLRSVGRLTVPEIADWCVVYIAEEDGTVRRLEVAAADPAKVEAVRELERRYPLSSDSSHAIHDVIRRGEPLFHPQLSSRVRELAARDADHLALLNTLAARSTMTLPLTVRGRTVGALALAMAESGRQYGPGDFVLGEELARRAALAVDNARLYAAERRTRAESERAVRRLERLQRVTAGLAESLTPAEVASVVVHQGLEALGASAGSVGVLDSERCEVGVIASVGYSPEATERYRRVSLSASFPIADAVREATAVFLADAAARDARYPHLAELRRANGGGAMVAVPLMADGWVIGVLGINFPETVTVGEEEHAFILALAQQCAQALERARLYEAELQARDEVAAARERNASILESITDGFVAMDQEFRYTYVNQKAAQLMRRPVEELLGGIMWEMFPATRDSELAHAFRRAMVERSSTQLESFSVALGAWVEVRMYPSPEGLSVFFQDISPRKRAEARSAFLSGASAILGSSLDYATTLTSVTRLAVPAVADWCAVEMLDETGELALVALANASPEKMEWARATHASKVLPAEPATGALKVVRTGEALFAPEVTDEMLRAASPNAESLAARQAVGMRSYICAPMTARGRTVGAITFLLTTESNRRYDEADLALAQELARRAATAIDNAMLYREVVEANQAKSDFLAVMSHELRTPLTAVIGYSELLADEIVGPVNATQKEQLSRIRTSSAHLLTLIEEILAFARIEAGQETVRTEGVELRALVREAQEVIEPLIARKQLRLVAELPDDRVMIDTDPGKLRQILLNLMANAVKFTDEGEIRVTLRRTPNAVELIVSDTGVGIPAEHMERIFDPFWQVEQTRTRKVGGTGLGLSVARQLARLLGGDLTAESEVGRGSTFRVCLGAAGLGGR